MGFFSECKTITFSKLCHPIECSYMLGQMVLERVSSLNDFGVILNQRMCFTKQIYVMVDKTLAILGFIRRILKALYMFLVRSNLQYASCVGSLLCCTRQQSWADAVEVFWICFAWSEMVWFIRKHVYFALHWHAFQEVHCGSYYVCIWYSVAKSEYIKLVVHDVCDYFNILSNLCWWFSSCLFPSHDLR
jgi:hypothetical protein